MRAAVASSLSLLSAIIPRSYQNRIILWRCRLASENTAEKSSTTTSAAHSAIHSGIIRFFRDNRCSP
jgi:hypothetical protein